MAVRNLIPALLCATLAAPAFGGVPLLPPAECDHPYDGPVELIQMPQREVYRECSKGNPGLRHDVNGCAWVENGVGYIVMVSHRTSRVRNLEHLYRHERAHLNCGDWH